MEYGTKPLTILTRYKNKPVMVTLKNDLTYGGVMIELDGYMNVVLEKASEYYNSERRATYPYILIRGNNIMYIKLGSEE
ncbi:MAG: hypothetical protein NZ920_01710 [Aigarchaeota archaeon]|nr:hypothetical protein [Aigarchaeota archaeon]MDW8093159.1 LSM domain-containing protein [Nitrososphaerota archaeon]